MEDLYWEAQWLIGELEDIDENWDAIWLTDEEERCLDFLLRFGKGRGEREVVEAIL